MDNTIYFHAKRVNARYLALVEAAKDEYQDEETRAEAYDMIAAWPKTHTFCFHNDEKALRVTWAKVFTGDKWEDVKGDAFSKKEGVRISSTKMARFVEKPPRTQVILNSADSIKPVLFDHLPACVADTLPWYLQRAARYFKVNDSKDVVIEGSVEVDDLFDVPRKRVAILSTVGKLK